MKDFNHIDPALRQHNPFVVPEGYFAQFAENLMSKLQPKKQVAGPFIPEMPFVKWIPWMGAACVAALACIFSLQSVQNKVNGSSEAYTANAAKTASFTDDMYDYLMLANADYTEYLADYENDY